MINIEKIFEDAKTANEKVRSGNLWPLKQQINLAEY
jgi:hypothetical protein